MLAFSINDYKTLSRFDSFVQGDRKWIEKEF